MSKKEERQPPLRIQFEQGYKAFFNGWLSNHYDKDTVNGKEWQRGFNAAYFDRLNYLERRDTNPPERSSGVKS